MMGLGYSHRHSNFSQLFFTFASLLLLPILCILVDGANAKKPIPALPRTEPQYRLDEAAEENAAKFAAGKCAFYCFFVPLKKDKLIDLHFYKKMSCSDIVYGFAKIGDTSIQFPTQMDLLPNSYYGNFKLITSLQLLSSSPRVLLGMKMASSTKFLQLENAEMAGNVTKRMVFHSRLYGFSGIFLKFPSNVLLTPGFEQFVEMLSAELENDQKKTHRQKLKLVLSISSNWVRYVYRRMPKFDAHFDAFYLWADEIDSADGGGSIPSNAIPVDPLHSSEQVPHKDALDINAERLAGTGVPRQKIIIGLSAWARTYFLRNVTDTKMPPEVVDFGTPGDETEQANGKLAFQEICMVAEGGPNGHEYDNQSETVTIRHDGDLWISYNEPEHEAFAQKLDWIAQHEFGGVGLYSLQGDDPNGNCSRGILPLHQAVANKFKCRRGTKRGNDQQMGECTRLCILDMHKQQQQEDNNGFHFDQLEPGWCSHLVLGDASINPFVPSLPTKGMQNALKMYNDWERQRKPFLILSFSGTPEQWSLATAIPAKLFLIDKIRRLLDEQNADGVEFNWENGGPRVGNPLLQFNLFLRDLRLTLGNRKQIMVRLNPNGFIEHDNYDFHTMSRDVDFFVAIGYRFHRYTNTNTGHPSPLFAASMLTQPRMTIQGMVEILLARGMAKEKLIVAVSAEAMSQDFADDNQMFRSSSSDHHQIGEMAARIYPRNRANGPGVVSQTTVCEIVKNVSSTITYFLHELGVPYLVSNEREFIAYDNKQSMQMKAVWISLQGLAGIALHGIELDNVGAQCPQNESFPLLRTIVRSQICARCNSTLPPPPSPAVADGPGTSSTDLSNEAAAIGEMEMNGTQMPSSSMEENVVPNEAANGTSEGKDQQQSFGMCQQQKEGKQPPNFGLFCTLPMAAIGQNLSVENLPLERCDSLLLSNWAILNPDGTTTTGQIDGQRLAKLVEMAQGNGTTLWAEMPCAMDSNQWEMLIGKPGNREQLAATLANLMDAKNLTGIFLDCDALMQPSSRASFSQLINEINAELVEKNANETRKTDCSPRLGLKLQLDRKNISEVYEPEQLNKLFKHILLPSSVALSKSRVAKLVNPLFQMGIAKDPATKVQSAIFSAWQSAGLNPNLILMELPAYGIKQKREGENSASVQFVGQKEVCEFMHKPGTNKYTRYDAVMAYLKTKDEWLSTENAQTIKYKVQYAIQHGFGGISLNSLDVDDPEDACNNGRGFPMLEMVDDARCGSGQRAYMERTVRHERDMLGSMMVSRGRR